MSDDAIDTRIRFYANYAPPPPRVRIGDATYVWPAGTTREQAQAVLDEAKLICLTQMTENHDPGDEDRS